MANVKKFGRRSISVILTLIMLITAVPVVSLPVFAEAKDEPYEVFGRVYVAPVIYTHGTYTGSVHDVSDNHQYDYMTYGTRVADGTYPGEFYTKYEANLPDGTGLISVTTTEGKTLGFGTLLANNNWYDGEEYKVITGDDLGKQSGTVTLKFTFSDNTYECHTVTVKTNPVAAHTITASFGWNWAFPGRYYRGVSMEILAFGSTGDLTTAGNENIGNAFTYDTANNESHHGGTGNFASMYAPYSDIFDAWEEDNNIRVDSMYSTTAGENSTDMGFAKVAGRYGLAQWQKFEPRSLSLTAPTANYYLDISRGDDFGVFHTAGSTNYSIKFLAGGLKWNGDDDHYTGTKATDADKNIGSVTRTSGSSTLSYSASADGATVIGFDAEHSAYGYATLSGTARVGTSQFNYVRRYGSGTSSAGILGSLYTTNTVTSPVKLVVTNKTEQRNAYKELVAKTAVSRGASDSNPMNEHCYTTQSWSAFHSAMLALEGWLNSEDGDTTQGNNLVTRAQSAFSALTLTSNTSAHNMSSATTVKANSCTEDGLSRATCSRCDYEVETIVPATGHNWLDTVVAPKCEEQGYTFHKCSNCGAEMKDNYVEALGHDYPNDGAYEVTEPTCTVAGYQTRTCTRCNTADTITLPATGHVWNGGEVTKAATCLETGIKTYTCEVCGATKTEVIPLADHKIKTYPAEEATCTKAGKTEGQQCEVCKKWFAKQTTIAKLPHEYGEYTANGDATCASDGTKSATCVNCGTIVTVPDIGSKDSAPHLTEGVEAVKENVVAPTCLVDGSHDEVVYCARCGREASRVKVTDEAGDAYHKWTYGSSSATCTEAGTITRTCSICGKTETSESSGTLDHVQYIAVEEKEATCTEPGRTAEIRCYVCGTVLEASEEKPALGHDIQKVDKKDATCFEAGQKEHYECARCALLFADEAGGEEITAESIEIPQLQHKAVEIQDAVEATCVTVGYTAGSECELCGTILEEVEEIPATGHTSKTVIEAVAATCLTDGKTAETECSVCGVTLSESEVIKATGHRAMEIKAVEPTCTETGLTQGSVCRNENCDVEKGEDGYHWLVKQRVIPALGHDYKGVITTEPTCTTEGVRTYTCRRCGDSYPEAVEMIAHSYTVLVTAQEDPTCTKTGKTAVYKCATCDATIGGETIEKLGHDYQTVTVEPTCTEAGYTANVCSRCDEEEPDSREIIPALDHDWDDGMIIAETPATSCTEGGEQTIEYTCSRCGESKQESKETPALDHTLVQEVLEQLVEPTCGFEIGIDGTEEDYVNNEENQKKGVGRNKVRIYCSVCGETIIAETEIDVAPLAHDFDETIEANVTIVSTATCADGGVKGVKTVKCSRCDSIKTITEPVPDHTPGKPEYSEPSFTDCTNGGTATKTIKCTVCGDVISTETVAYPAQEHTPGETQIENKVEGTKCTDITSWDEVVYCTVCKKEISKTHKEIPGAEHDFDDTIEENVTIVPATCTVSGSKTVKCKNCDEKQVTPLPAPGHVSVGEEFEIDEDRVEAACGVEGGHYVVTYCANSKDEDGNYTHYATKVWVVDPALEHEAGEVKRLNEIEATCEHGGYYEEVTYCKYCGEEIDWKYVDTPQLEHHDDDGDGLCDECGNSMKDPNCKHVKDLINYKDATCIEDGYSGDIYCSKCDTILEKGHVLPKEGGTHKIVIDEAVEPTCTSTGLTVGKHCDLCGIVFDAQREVPKTEHKQINIPGKQATCVEPGESDATVCAVCGLVITPHRIINTTTHHVDANGDGKCDVCGIAMQTNCNCLCHKTSWISKALYKFVLFFWKLFGISKTCDCGAVHY